MNTRYSTHHQKLSIMIVNTVRQEYALFAHSSSLVLFCVSGVTKFFLYFFGEKYNFTDCECGCAGLIVRVGVIHDPIHKWQRKRLINDRRSLFWKL